MSETSEEKTKRKYLQLMNDYEWSYQYSIFYDDPSYSCRLLEDMVGFKQALRRKWPDTAFLIRIQSHRREMGAGSNNKVLQAFLSILSTSKLQGIMDGFLDPLFAVQVNIMYKRLSIDKQKRMYQAIAQQMPHDLSKVFKDKTGPIKRYTILNKTKLAKRENPLTELNAESS
ncbi:hypothetical protein [Pseudomonas sp. SST3]|uniref:hypothetical protein n=1 Tax=Pseudomonas sp. SST3 TaxID=2267882 RepID=UPI001443CE3F|nr:hypothetical protein [Pseudomonas sp. SST3]NKQ10643.1 hypothetical protein [Pseudomonas sp. SST3]